MIKLDGKFMHETTKKGWVIQDYLNHFEVSEKDFFDCLKKTFSKKAFQRIVRRLKSNQKQPKHQKQQNTASPSATPELSIPSETITDAEEKSSIEVLEDEEKSLSDILCKKECDRVKLLSKRNELKKVFIEQRARLVTLTKQLEESKTIVNNCYNKWLKVSSDIDNIGTEISEVQKTLENIREEIQELKKVSIFIYENGEIEIDNADVSLLTDSTEEAQLFDNLLRNKLVESLTIKQIRQLSKVIIVVKNIINSGLKYEITFESTSLEEVFTQINN